MRLRNQLLIATEIFGGEDNLSPVPIQTISKGMDELLKLSHKLIDVMDRANRKICVTLLRYNENKPESSCVCEKEGGQEVSPNFLCE